MSQKLKDKVAVITGGTSGIGLATASLYVDEGATVISTARTDDSAQKAREAHGSRFDIVKADMTILGDLEALATYVREKYGHVDIVFANAGIAKFSPLDAIDEEFFDVHLNTNVKGVLFTIKYLSPMLSEGASVVLTTSGLNTKGMAGSAVYAATKAAVRSFARTLSAELIQRGIRVNALSPGPIETPIYGKMGMSEAEVNDMAGHILTALPIGRFGTSDEMARVALFLGSSDSSFLVGAEVVADGGFSQL